MKTQEQLAQQLQKIANFKVAHTQKQAGLGGSLWGGIKNLAKTRVDRALLGAAGGGLAMYGINRLDKQLDKPIGIKTTTDYAGKEKANELVEQAKAKAEELARKLKTGEAFDKRDDTTRNVDTALGGGTGALAGALLGSQIGDGYEGTGAVLGGGVGVAAGKLGYDRIKGLMDNYFNGAKGTA